jgi:RNA-directed DNA polymerase
MLSNIVLDELDQELAWRNHRFVRYADDANLFVHIERAGQRVMTSIRGFLEKRMRLQVNEEKNGVRKPDEMHFLGCPFHCKTGSEGGDVAIYSSAKNVVARVVSARGWSDRPAICQVSGFELGRSDRYR